MTKEEIRNELYHFIEQTFGKMSHETRKQIRKLVIQHDQAESKAKPEKKMEFLKGKITYYTNKARHTEQTDRVVGQTEALEWCYKWLNETEEL